MDWKGFFTLNTEKLILTAVIFLLLPVSFDTGLSCAICYPPERCTPCEPIYTGPLILALTSLPRTEIETYTIANLIINGIISNILACTIYSLYHKAMKS